MVLTSGSPSPFRLRKPPRRAIKWITMHYLSRMRLKTARAWRIKEMLREILIKPKSREEAEQLLLKKWYSWARRCRLDPFKRMALTVRDYWQGIFNRFHLHLSNGAVGGMNGQIQAAKARGFRHIHNLITVSLGLWQDYPSSGITLRHNI